MLKTNDSKIKISPSKCKTYCDCSNKFYLNYIEKVPQPSQIFFDLGTLAHFILELLNKNAKRLDIVKKIIEADSLDVYPNIQKIILKHINRYKLGVEDAIKIEKWVLCGLKNNYLHEGAISVETEKYFSIDIGNNLILNGFIDKLALYSDRICIQDFKSSKSRYSGDDKTANIQSALYIYAAKQLYPQYEYKDIGFNFIFLNFAKNPIIEIKYSKDQIEGTLEWVRYIGGLMHQWQDTDRYKNLAIDDFKTKWQCFSKGDFKCGYLMPMEYWEWKNEQGEKKTSIEKPINVAFPQKKIQYNGCQKAMEAYKRSR